MQKQEEIEGILPQKSHCKRRDERDAWTEGCLCEYVIKAAQDSVLVGLQHSVSTVTNTHFGGKLYIFIYIYIIFRGFPVLGKGSRAPSLQVCCRMILNGGISEPISVRCGALRFQNEGVALEVGEQQKERNWDFWELRSVF